MHLSQRPPRPPGARSTGAPAAAAAVKPKSLTSLSRLPAPPRAEAAAAGGRGAPAPPPPPTAPAPVTDASVPEGHKGLHASLYGEGGAEEAHGVAAQAEDVYEVVPGEDGGEAILPIQPWLAAREAAPPIAGVFAIYSAARALQYVSFARHAPRAVRAAATRAGEERAAFVRALLFANKAMVSRKALQEQADRWLAEVGTTPPGNGVERGVWERDAGATGAVLDGMTSSEAEEHEGRKAKLEAAMGVKGAAVAAEPSTPEEKRQAWMKAVGKGDWSAVIDGQTAATTPGGGGGGLAAAAGGPPAQPASPPVTPFARAAVHRRVGADAAAADAAAASTGSAPPARPALTVESAEAALDEVRPYLIADGGNVEVLSVEGGRVLLKLQGACGSCASSGATMSMGLERALRAAFGDAVKEVIEVGGAGGSPGSASSAGPPLASVEAVDGHLGTLRPALAAYGASVEPVSVRGGVCMVRFTGPAPILMGVTAALKDRFPDIKEVREWKEEDYE